MEILGVILGLVILIAVYLVTMWIYTRARRRWYHTKFGVELWTVLVVFLFCFVVRLVILIPNTDGGIGGGAAAFFEAVYQAVGSFTFEGLAKDSLMDNILFCLYSGTALYLGLIMVSVVTSKVSYEIFSYFSLKLSPKRKNCIYVFTAVNEESLTLAESVKKDDKKCIIIFSGSEIGPFDGKNDFCRRIVSNGFLYWSYPNAKKGEKISIAKRLSCNIKNLNDYKRRFVVFAFEQNDQFKPLDENNSDIVFTDIEARTKKKDNLRIEYYILTRKEANYQAYEAKNKVLCEAYGDKEKYEKRVKIELINEANIIAHQSTKSLEPMFDDIYKEGKEVKVWSLGFGYIGQAILKQLYTHCSFVGRESKEANGFYAQVFDSQIADHDGVFLYENPLIMCRKKESDAKAKYNSSIHKPYDCEIKDAKIEEKREDYEHNYSKEVALLETDFYNVSCTSYEFIKKIDEVTGRAEGGADERPDIFVIATGDDHRNIRLANLLINDIGNEIHESKEIIQQQNKAQTKKGEGAKEQGKNIKKQLIIVHVRDRRNNHLIIEAGGEKRQGEYTKNLFLQIPKNDPHLFVSIVGNADEVFSSADILEHAEAAKYTAGYGCLYAVLNNDLQKVKEEAAADKSGGDNQLTYVKKLFGISASLRALMAFETPKKNHFTDTWISLMKEILFDYTDERENKIGTLIESLSAESELYGKATKGLTRLREMVKKVFEPYINDPFNFSEKEWFKDSAWSSESNQNALLYAWVFKKLFENIKGPTPQDYAWLANIEHQRWMRFHIANGWRYGEDKGKNKFLKRHNCILPSKYIPLDKVLFDVVNVLWALKRDGEN